MATRAAERDSIGSAPRAAGILARLGCRWALDAGLDLAPLLQRARLTPEQMRDRQFRPAVRDQVRLLDLLAQALDDELFGHHLTARVDLREMGFLYYVGASAATLHEAMRRLARYGTLGNEGIALRCTVVERLELSLRFVGVSRHLDRHQTEGWLTVLFRMLRQLTGRKIEAELVRFVHPRPNAPRELAAFFGGPVEFGAAVDEIAIAASWAESPVVSADPYLHELLVRYCEEALSRRRTRGSELRVRVENAITPLLPHGEARADEVARHLGLSRRTLTRRLAAEGLSFEGILDALRLDLAHRYLADRDLTISEIAWLLGYRESSAFSRAFRRWTGKSPREGRQKESSAKALRRA